MKESADAEEKEETNQRHDEKRDKASGLAIPWNEMNRRRPRRLWLWEDLLKNVEKSVKDSGIRVSMRNLDVSTGGIFLAAVVEFMAAKVEDARM